MRLCSLLISVLPSECMFLYQIQLSSDARWQVRPGDLIVSIDGVSVKEFSIADVKKLIAGEVGSKVNNCCDESG